MITVVILFLKTLLLKLAKSAAVMFVIIMSVTAVQMYDERLKLRRLIKGDREVRARLAELAAREALEDSQKNSGTP